MYEPYENQDSQSQWDSSYQYIPPKKEKTGWNATKVIALTLVCSLLSGFLGAGCIILYDRISEDPQILPSKDSTVILESNRENAVIDITKIEAGKLMTPAEVYASNVNSTVGIRTSITTNFLG